MQAYKAQEAVTGLGAAEGMITEKQRMNRRLLITRFILVVSIIVNVKLIFG
ncbi:MAG: hypothetical protein ABF683_12685 [Sporolactobacillus sp.]